MSKYIRGIRRLSKAISTTPSAFSRLVNTLPSLCQAESFSRSFADSGKQRQHPFPSGPPNPLWDYFSNHRQGAGIWKWEHYFDIYHRHFSRFVGLKVDVMEIGVYAGGSLEMWRSYFGNKSHIYGVDIQHECEIYENNHTTILIGDQADRGFWRNFRNTVDGIDILIDDGGHTPEQQRITLEEMLPFLRPGGVYLCEDVHERFNQFCAFAIGLVNDLNACGVLQGPNLQSNASQFQSAIHSIHFYPYVVVIEKNLAPVATLSAARHGTHWQPFGNDSRI